MLVAEVEAPLKTDTVVESSRNPVATGNYSSDDEDGFEHFKDRQHIEEYLRYNDQVYESNGFDVDFVPRQFRQGIGGHILPCDLNDPQLDDLITRCTDVCINLHNRLMNGSSHLECRFIEKANRSGNISCLCYITFDAFDTISRLTHTYQAKVFCNQLSSDNFKVYFIRRKGQKQAILFPSDLTDTKEYDRIEKWAAFAISEHNELGNSQLKLVKVTKALRDSWASPSWYIALDAEDMESGHICTYYTKVIDISNGPIYMAVFERKDEVTYDEFAALEGDE